MGLHGIEEVDAGVVEEDNWHDGCTGCLATAAFNFFGGGGNGL